jgi:hypothetical protein
MASDEQKNTLREALVGKALPGSLWCRDGRCQDKPKLCGCDAVIAAIEKGEKDGK